MNTLASITSEQVASYRQKGYTVLRGLFDAQQVAAWNAECDRLLGLADILHEDNLRTRFRKHANGVWIVDKFDPLVDISPVFRGVVEDDRLLAALAALFGDEPRLFKDKLIFKPADQAGYGMHQDWTYWQPWPPHLLSVMVAIDGADAENGALEVFPGYHDRYLQAPHQLRDLNAEEIKQIDMSKGEVLETQPGDLIVFHCLTPHRSGQNRSKRSRRQLYLTYNPKQDGDLYKAHYVHYEKYVRSFMKPADQKRLFFI